MNITKSAEENKTIFSKVEINTRGGYVSDDNFGSYFPP